MAASDPSFFKCISNQSCFERIKIAPGYVTYKQGMLPSSVILKHQDGNHWHVQVEKEQNEFFFTKGWKKFVDDKEVGDFVVFYCIGLNVFDVVLFGHDSCEKEENGGSETNLVERERENVVEEQDGMEDSQREPIDEDGEVEVYVDEKYEVIDMVKIPNNDIEDEVIDVFNKEIQNPMSGASGKAQIKRDEIQSEHGGSNANKAQHGKKMKGDRIFQERNMSPPKNPYFVTKIRRERRNQVLIPVYIVKDHNLELPGNIILKDIEGRVWKSQLTTWEDGRKWYFGGWSDLCKENCVNKNDLLACEFAKEKGKTCLTVQILRG